MKPSRRDLDEEIQGHLALAIKERIERGEDPEAARLAALKEFGNVLLTRDSIQRVWRPGWFDGVEALLRDIRFAFRSLTRAKGLTSTVVVTLALGIGANAAIFSVVKSVLLRPLVNRDADRLIYIRQIAPGISNENMTFSMPEIRDITSRVKTLNTFGDFSTVNFTLIAFGGEPRVVTAGVVNGTFFEVMGLRPAFGRLVNAGDDRPGSASVAVLTHKFWMSQFQGDSSVVGKAVRLGPGMSTIIGVLEPSVPYPAETQVMANVVTSPHHLGATMVNERWHRMTELFGRLAPGATLEQARAELVTVHAAMMSANPDDYSKKAQVQLHVTTLREQLASPARSILLLLLAAAGVVFIIACSNVANLILGRSIRRETELAVRAALGAGRGALRRTLFAESLILCAGGALLGLVLAWPLVTVLSRYAARFSIRALEARVDGSVLWLGAALALAAAVALAFVPRLPSERSGLGLGSSGSRMTPGTNRRLRALATTQIACSFVLLTGAGTLIATLNAMQTANTGFDMRRVLAIDVPPAVVADNSALAFFDEAARKIGELPGVEAVASGMIVPWRDVWSGLQFQFGFEGYEPAEGEEPPTCRFRPISPRFFGTLGVPILAGRDFTELDRDSTALVAIVSHSLAQRMFPNGEALNRDLWFASGRRRGGPPRRIVGVVADVDDQSVVQEPTLTVYVPCRQLGAPTRLFVRAANDPYTLVPAVTRTLRKLSADQAIERPATLEDVRAEVLTPERLSVFVFTAFGGIALLIAIVGVAGVLAFSVSARTREFGIRLAIGAAPWQVLAQVLREGLVIVSVGITAGAVAGYALARIASTYLENVRGPGVVPAVAAASVLVAAALIASLVPAARAARVDVLHALRSE